MPKKIAGQPRKPENLKRNIPMAVYASKEEIKRFGGKKEAHQALKDAWNGLLGLPFKNS